MPPRRVHFSKASLKAVQARADADPLFRSAAEEALHEAQKVRVVAGSLNWYCWSGCELCSLPHILVAHQAYSPYTRCPSGASIITYDGRAFSGGCVESAAYNPSLSPFHSAYIEGVTGGTGFEQIKEVVLVELKGAPVSHKNNIKLLLRAVSPQASLTVLHLEWDK